VWQQRVYTLRLPNTTALPTRYTTLTPTNRSAPEGLQWTGLTTHIDDSRSDFAKDSAPQGCYTMSTGKHLPKLRRKCLHLQGQAVFFMICFTLKIYYNLQNIQSTNNFSDAGFSIILLFTGSPSTMTCRASIIVMYYNQCNPTHVGFSNM
jgi:hypothetical protein